MFTIYSKLTLPKTIITNFLRSYRLKSPHVNISPRSNLCLQTTPTTRSMVMYSLLSPHSPDHLFPFNTNDFGYTVNTKSNSISNPIKIWHNLKFGFYVSLPYLGRIVWGRDKWRAEKWRKDKRRNAQRNPKTSTVRASITKDRDWGPGVGRWYTEKNIRYIVSELITLALKRYTVN